MNLLTWFLLQGWVLINFVTQIISEFYILLFGKETVASFHPVTLNSWTLTSVSCFWTGKSHFWAHLPLANLPKCNHINSCFPTASPRAPGSGECDLLPELPQVTVFQAFCHLANLNSLLALCQLATKPILHSLGFYYRSTPLWGTNFYICLNRLGYGTITNNCKFSMT